MTSRKRKAGDAEDEDEDQLIIAIDFGTTYSKVAFCFANHDDPKPTAIMDWPGSRGISMPKVPTAIKYGSGGDLKWGLEADKTSGAITGIKLLLDPTQRRPTHLFSDSSQKGLDAVGKSAVDVAGDIMRAIYQHALAEISKTIPEGYLEMCSKVFVLTVPAVWSEGAKHATMRAAEIAGIHPVTLIKEPEAAALFATQSMNFALNPGDAFVVCDAGGGTVDLISYEVESIHPRLCVRELVPGTGGMSGSVRLNIRFDEAVQAQVGHEQWMNLQGTRALKTARNQYDREIKEVFDGNRHSQFCMNFPMGHLRGHHPEKGLKCDSWELTGRKLGIAPLIAEILELIGEQVNRSIAKRGGKVLNGILLVGGFGSSQYLRQQVVKKFPDIQVIQPNDAWAAVVKGAVISKIPRKAVVTSVCATRHLGVEAWHPYDRKIDRGQASRTDRTGRVEVERMMWYIKKGEDLRRNQKVTFPFFREVDAGYLPDDLVFDSELYDCDEEQAPRHRSSSVSVSMNCKIRCDLSTVPKSFFKRRRDVEGKIYYEVYYDLVVTLESAVMTFSVEVNRKIMGSVEAKFD